MNIFACIKQVPDTTTRIKLRGDGNGIDEADIQWIISPHDELAIEEALRLREQQPDSVVTVLSAGPERVTDSLRMALAMGADSAMRLDLPDDADSSMNARALAAAIGKLGSADIVFTGKEAIDDGAAAARARAPPPGPRRAAPRGFRPSPLIWSAAALGWGRFDTEPAIDGVQLRHGAAECRWVRLAGAGGC